MDHFMWKDDSSLSNRVDTCHTNISTRMHCVGSLAPRQPHRGGQAIWRSIPASHQAGQPEHTPDEHKMCSWVGTRIWTRWLISKWIFKSRIHGRKTCITRWDCSLQEISSEHALSANSLVIGRRLYCIEPALPYTCKDAFWYISKLTTNVFIILKVWFCLLHKLCTCIYNVHKLGNVIVSVLQQKRNIFLSIWWNRELRHQQINETEM